MTNLYIIYGRNLSKRKMQKVCPTANPIAVATLKEQQLVFQGSPYGARANVVPADGHEVPVVVWEISDQDVQALDSFEGLADCLSTKKYMEIDVNGETRCAAIYTLDSTIPYGIPSDGYLQDMADGYREFNLPITALNEAVANAYENALVNEAVI